MVNRRFMRQLIAVMFTCGLAAVMFWPQPVAASVEIIFFRAVSGENKITLEWETETETDFLGFIVYRSSTDDLDDATSISSLIPAQGLPPTGGAPYAYDDTSVDDNVIYYYWLGTLDNGQTEPNDYQGPVGATTQGGVGISTPTPTSSAPPATTATNTPVASPTSNGSATEVATTAPTRQNGTATVNPTATVAPSPTIDLTPSRIPAGTFPQPPTPTRFTFAQTPGATSSSPANTDPGSGNSGTEGSAEGGEGVPPQSTASTEEAFTDFGSPSAGVTPTSLAALPDAAANNPQSGADVIGQTNEPVPGIASDLLAPPDTTATSETQGRISPLLIMGLMIGTVFTFGGAITTLFVLSRKR